MSQCPQCLGRAREAAGGAYAIGGLDANNTNVATVWRSQQLNVPDSVPVFTSQPGTAATYLGLGLPAVVTVFIAVAMLPTTSAFAASPASPISPIFPENATGGGEQGDDGD